MTALEKEFRFAEIRLFCVGLAFWWDAFSGRFAMSEFVHGAAVYAMPATWWAGAVMFIHGFTFFALGSRKIVLCIAGYVLQMVLYGTFAILSTGAEFGGVVVYFASVYFVWGALDRVFAYLEKAGAWDVFG